MDCEHQAMSKQEALCTLIREAQSERVSNASVQRVVKALVALEVSDQDLLYALQVLDIARSDGSPYSPKVKRTWK